ncbi:MAG: hypothetical protein JRJ38_05865 [Deltaproteobacteria bacterium]|nr:hypothetical protein [Deltaproteobacteria bacterium]
MKHESTKYEFEGIEILDDFVYAIVKISITPQNDNVGFTNIKVSLALENAITAEPVDSIREKVLTKIKNAIDIDKLICD